ncbi:MAG: hypothetical protein V4612_06695 [Pseudomonadota bacterium]
MKPTKITTLLLLTFFSSCVFLTENSLDQTISSDSFLNRFPENQKAIIIFKLNGKRSERLYLCAKEDDQNCRTIYATNQYNILMLSPNLYHLFAPPENRPLFSDKKAKQQEKYLTILEAKAGEIIYVGDIFYKQAASNDEDKSTKILNNKFAVNDNFELVENILSGKNSRQKEKLFANQTWEINYLIQKYPSLKKRFKKRLLKSSEVIKPNLKNKKITQNAQENR